MKRAPFTAKEQQYIKDHRLKMPGRKIAEALGCSKTKVENYLRRHDLRVPKELSNKWRSQAHKGKTSFEPWQTQFLKENYLKLPVKALAARIGKSSTSVNIRMRQLDLKIPKEVIAQRKKESQFHKGMQSWNKGKKQSDYMSPEMIERTKKNHFKKGHIPHNVAEADGVISLRKDHKTGFSYKYVRVALGHWELLHREVWKKANGPIPNNKVVRFKDGDTMNCALDNLELISMAENLRRNWHEYPAPLKKAIKLTNRIKKEL